MLKAHYDQSRIALQSLNSWHETNISRFEIDINAGRRKRQGFDGFIMNFAAIFNDKLHYHEIDYPVIHSIQEQTQGDQLYSYSNVNLFQEDVRLICKDGKFYYLPSEAGM